MAKLKGIHLMLAEEVGLGTRTEGYPEVPWEIIVYNFLLYDQTTYARLVNPQIKRSHMTL